MRLQLSEVKGMAMQFVPLILLVLLGVFLSRPAYALTGDELLRQCSATADSPEQKQCESYIEGVVSAIHTLTTSMQILHPESGSYPQLFCVPRLTATKDLVAVTVSYLAHNVNSRHYDASSEILLALEQAYPCKE